MRKIQDRLTTRGSPDQRSALVTSRRNGPLVDHRDHLQGGAATRFSRFRSHETIANFETVADHAHSACGPMLCAQGPSGCLDGGLQSATHTKSSDVLETPYFQLESGPLCAVPSSLEHYGDQEQHACSIETYRMRQPASCGHAWRDSPTLQRIFKVALSRAVDGLRQLRSAAMTRFSVGCFGCSRGSARSGRPPRVS